jgi:predicted nucleic acid-binding protein
VTVCDSGPLIHLSRIGKLKLLKQLFSLVWITESTYNEVVQDGKTLRKAGVLAVEEAIQDGWIKIAKLQPRNHERAARQARSESIDESDAEAIQLAIKTGAPLITNDRMIILSARTLEVECLWTTSPLLRAVKARILTASEALHILQELAETGLHMRLEVYEALRTAIQELQ